MSHYCLKDRFHAVEVEGQMPHVTYVKLVDDDDDEDFEEYADEKLEEGEIVEKA